MNYFSEKISVDTSVGDYKEQQLDDIEDKKIIDVNRLEMIQNEDQERDFSDLMQKPVDEVNTEYKIDKTNSEFNSTQTAQPAKEVIYKVFVGSYSSYEQANVAKEIIQESGSGLNPIVKCIGTNEFTLQVGRYRNKQGAEAMLSLTNKNNLPGRIVQE